MRNSFLVLLLGFLALHAAAQSDKANCQDHPLVSRYPGALIEYCDTRNFAEFSIPTGPETGYRQIDKWVNVSGRHTRIYYSIKGEKTATEVYQNYLSALNTAGFSLLASKLHPERNVSTDVGGNAWLVTFYRTNPFPSNAGIRINAGSGTLGGTFYAAAKKNNVYLALSGKRYSDNETVVLLDVLETEDMEDGLISVNAGYIADRLFNEGRIALEGIHFDHDKAIIRDDSKPLLEEIARFLQKYPTVAIFVVGHTDITGEVEYNIGLSAKRAKAVVEYLVTQHQVTESRLFPYGVGPLAPAGSNSTEAGKTKNRRVELVLRSR